MMSEWAVSFLNSSLRDHSLLEVDGWLLFLLTLYVFAYVLKSGSGK